MAAGACGGGVSSFHTGRKQSVEREKERGEVWGGVREEGGRGREREFRGSPGCLSSGATTPGVSSLAYPVMPSWLTIWWSQGLFCLYLPSAGIQILISGRGYVFPMSAQD